MLLSVLGLSETTVVRAHVPIFRTVDKKLDWVLLQFPLPGDSDSSDDVREARGVLFWATVVVAAFAALHGCLVARWRRKIRSAVDQE